MPPRVPASGPEPCGGNKGLEPDEKRWTVDSFGSAQKWSSRLVSFTAVDRLTAESVVEMQAITNMHHNQLRTIMNLAVIACYL